MRFAVPATSPAACPAACSRRDHVAVDAADYGDEVEPARRSLALRTGDMSAAMSMLAPQDGPQRGTEAMHQLYCLYNTL